MAKTLFEKANQAFSNKAHQLALRYIYPKIFGPLVAVKNTGLEDGEIGEILDGKCGIDRIIYTRGGIPFSIQERFRDSSYAHRRDLTITKFNRASGEISELHKCIADYFIYGYLNESETGFIEVLVINYRELRRHISRGEIFFARELNRKNQEFIAIPFWALEKKGVVAYHYTQDKEEAI